MVCIVSSDCSFESGLWSASIRERIAAYGDVNSPHYQRITTQGRADFKKRPDGPIGRTVSETLERARRSSDRTCDTGPRPKANALMAFLRARGTLGGTNQDESD